MAHSFQGMRQLISSFQAAEVSLEWVCRLSRRGPNRSGVVAAPSVPAGTAVTSAREHLRVIPGSPPLESFVGLRGFFDGPPIIPPT
jgi:hypothetical protein